VGVWLSVQPRPNIVRATVRFLMILVIYKNAPRSGKIYKETRSAWVKIEAQ
jgi:hypothetical protein